MVGKKKKTAGADVASKTGEQEWFYSKIVKKHFFNPKNFLKSTQELQKLKPNGYGIVGSPACLVSGSKIHTNPDFKNIESLEKGTKVLSHDGKYNEIIQTFERDYSGDLITIQNQFGTVSLTPEHLVYAMKKPAGHKFNYAEGKKKLYPAWYCAEQLERKDIFLYPIPKEVKNIGFLEISQEKAKWDFKSKQVPEKVKITPELLELFGIYIAEGHSRRSEIGFTLSIKEGAIAEMINKNAKSIFGISAKIKERKEQNRLDITVGNVFLSKFFAKLFGKGAENKQVPNELILLEPELQKSLIKGVWQGDGCINLKRKHPRAGYSTISYKLAHQLKLLLLRQKIGCSIYTELEKTRKGVNHKKSYRLHVGDLESVGKLAKILGIDFDRKSIKRRTAIFAWFDNNYYYAAIKKVTKSQFNGKVYNAEIANAHSYITENLTAHNCGDKMDLWIKVDPKTERIKECKWKTFGCASAIASTSMLSTMVSEKGGMKIEKALKITPQDIMKRLGGLPARKVHCSVLGDKALRAAINDYYRNTKQFDKVVDDGKKVIDKVLGTTDNDIEHAVLEGAKTFEEVQQKTKVGVHDKECIPQVMELIHYYRKKHFNED
ncbi:MAG: iron-sulfur cluster assembly scaffold protein [Candidatus Diapherotrites archaeon]|nr:iron-sulfur cluster assembly scaffold protein [Candidatus Diapherotrites archaeon]